MRTFSKIPAAQSAYATSEILLQAIPYDGTSTWGKGADKGFDAFLEASRHMDMFDIETRSEVWKRGIHILPDISGFSRPEHMVHTINDHVSELLESGKFLTFFGGEHSISIGILRAFCNHYDDLTIVQLDAHADLRPHYKGSPYNHACALYEASQNANLVQVGIRALDTTEAELLDSSSCYFARDIMDHTYWMTESISKMTRNVYITFDFDVFDPSIFPSTGTPEPGGLDWYTVTEYLRMIFAQKNVVGFDMVELAPIPELRGPDFLAAKLYYKMLSYKFEDKQQGRLS